MNKTLVVLVSVMMCLGISQAQDKAQSIITLDLGIGGSIQGAKIKTPAVYGTYEYFVGDRISVGGLLGYSQTSVEVHNWTEQRYEEEKESNISAGGLVRYYLVRNEQWDVYFGTALGYASALTGGFLYEFAGGTRYAVSDKIALHSELGFGQSLLKAGVSFNL